ncbi:MAG: 50S ribosomal protein L17 [Candidatus Microgenomates bacterium]
MRHKVKKIKFKYGKDANEMLSRKLAINFLKTSYIETTLIKAKVLKSHLEKLLSKTKVYTKSNNNYLLKYLGNQKLVKDLFKNIGPSLKEINGGYVKISKLDYRDGDGSLMAKVQWAHPVLKIENNDNKKLNVKSKKITEKNEKTNSTDKTS